MSVNYGRNDTLRREESAIIQIFNLDKSVKNVEMGGDQKMLIILFSYAISEQNKYNSTFFIIK